MTGPPRGPRLLRFAGARVAAAASFTAGLVLLAGAPAAYGAATLQVNAATGTDSPTCGTTTPCRTIGQAVANASGGDTIQVAAGTYDEPVSVDKSLTLEGAQAGTAGSAARAASPADESVVTGGAVDVAAPDVTLDGFSFAYAGTQVCVTCFQSTLGLASGVTIEDNVFSGYEADCHGDWCVTAALGVNGAPDTHVTGNYFTSPDIPLGDFGGAVVQWFDGGCSGADVSGNTFDAADQSALSDIYFWCDSEAGQPTTTITVSGNRDVNMGESDFALFTHIAGGAEVDVTGNRVAMTPESSSGIYFSTDAGLDRIDISGNTLTGSPFRAVKLNGNARIAGAVTITGNDFSKNGVGVYVGAGALASGATVTLRGNNLSGETGGSAGDGPDGLFVDPGAGGSVDAIDNWWGCNGGPGTPGCSAGTAFEPWLVLGISASPSSLQAGGSSTVTADVTRDSAGNDTSGSATIPDGTTIDFATDLGTLSAPAAGTSAGKASVTLTSAAPGTAHVSATLDSQTVSTTVTFTPATPTSADQCKKGGWQSFGGFKNQGDCVSFVATGGKNRPNG